MTTEEEEEEETVSQAMRRLGLKPPIEDEELDKELDEMLAAFPPDTTYGKLMGEARRRFLYRKDLDIVASALKKKTMQRKWLGCGTSSLFF